MFLQDPVARKFVLLVDFQGVGLGSLVPLTVRDLMVVMQDHYPERLGSAFFVNTPWLLHSFFTAASAFLDPVTLAKFNFVSEDTSQTMEQHFDLSALEKSFGGCDDEPFCSHIFLNTHSGEGVPQIIPQQRVQQAAVVTLNSPLMAMLRHQLKEHHNPHQELPTVDPNPQCQDGICLGKEEHRLGHMLAPQDRREVAPAVERDMGAGANNHQKDDYKSTRYPESDRGQD
eukprot:s172_g34.t1